MVMLFNINNQSLIEETSISYQGVYTGLYKVPGC